MAHLFQPRFWSDPTIRAWPEADRLLALYLLTCPDRATEGLYRLRPHAVADDLAWEVVGVRDGLRRLAAHGFIKWDEQADVVLLVDVLRGMPALNPGQVGGAVNRVDSLPPTPLLRELYADA